MELLGVFTFLSFVGRVQKFPIAELLLINLNRVFFVGRWVIQRQTDLNQK